jgi:hypothetical protein
MKQQFIKLVNEIEKENEKLNFLKKNFEFQIHEKHEMLFHPATAVSQSPVTGKTTATVTPATATATAVTTIPSSPTPSTSMLYDRFLSAVFDLPTTPDQEIEKQMIRIHKLEKEKEKKSKEMEEKKTQLLFALEEKDRVWAAVSRCEAVSSFSVSHVLMSC